MLCKVNLRGRDGVDKKCEQTNVGLNRGLFVYITYLLVGAYLFASIY